jgi:MFS family permease
MPATAAVHGTVAAPQGAVAPANEWLRDDAWQMLALATLAMVATTPGQTFGFSFFIPEFRQSLGLTSSQVSAAYLLATLGAAFPLAWGGGLVDRWGLRRTLLATLVALAASCALMALVQSSAMLLLGFFALRTVGPGMLSLVAGNTLALWFDRRLGAASSVMQLAMAAAIAVGPALLFALIQACGWRAAYLVLALLIGAGLLPLAWRYYRERPAHAAAADGPYLVGGPDAGPAPLPSLNLAQAVRTSAFWLLLAAVGAWSLIGTGLMFHVEAIFAERHATSAQAAWASTAMAGSMALLQLGGGFLADRLAVATVLGVAMATISAGCCALALAVNGEQCLVGYALYGAGQGMMSIVAATGWPRFFGNRYLGSIRGVVVASTFALASLGPLATGLSADYLRGVAPSLWGFAALAGCLALASSLARPPERRQLG